MVADLVVLDRDLSQVADHGLADVEVESTWLAGWEVHRRGE